MKLLKAVGFRFKTGGRLVCPTFEGLNIAELLAFLRIV